MGKRHLIAPMVWVVIAAGCAGSKPKATREEVKSSAASTPSKATSIRGMASWYGGKRFQGKKTASGERFSRKAFTCAHRTLPFGTRIRVLDLATGKSVEVRVTDRGPFAQNRLIDLSEAAARSIDLIRRGTTEVELTIL